MGRKAKPTNVKILEGNRGKRALPDDEPKPDYGAPDKPDHLSEVASGEWDRLVPQLEKLGLITKIDQVAFAAYCECYADVIAARKEIETFGRVFLVGNQLKKNPAVQMLNDSLRLMRQYLTEFGLTPAARSRVASQMKEDPNQPRLPGVDGKSENPDKSTLPGAPANVSDYFSTAKH